MLRLSLRNFGSLIIRHTLSFILIISGLLTTCFGLLFIFGREYSEFIDWNSFSAVSGIMKVSIKQDASTREVQDLLRFFIDDGGENFPEASCLTTTDNSKQLIVAEYNLHEPKYWLMSGEYLDQGAKKEVLLSEGYMKGLSSDFLHEIYGKEIKIDNISFTIIGSYSCYYNYDNNGGGVIIPLWTYVNLGYPIQYLDIFFPDSFSSDEESYIVQKLSENRMVERIDMPDKVDAKYFSKMFSTVVKHFLLLSVSLVTLLNLLRYWLKRSWSRFRVYIICGATNNKIMFVIIFNSLLMSLFSTVIAWSSYAIVQPFLMKYRIITEYPWFFSAGICFTVMLISVIYTIIVGVQFLRKQNLSLRETI